MRLKKDWSSFFPVLIKAVQNTSGPVMELGSGFFSTPLLHWLCAEQGRRLVTYEDQQKHYSFARRFQTDTHEVNFVTDWDKVSFDKTKWSVVLIDHGVKRRTKDILRLKNCAKYIIIHDTENKIFGYDKIWSKFKYVYHWNFNLPRTSVVSNSSKLDIFNLTKGLVYYTDNTPEKRIFLACQKQLNRCMKQWKFPIYSISQKPINFGINTVMNLDRSVLSMFKQILRGLEECKTDIVFLIEHDLLYHPSHFNFTPEKDDHFYFNLNFWNISSVDGKAVYYIHNDVSMLCAYRSLLLRHYRKVVEWVEKMGFRHSWGFSPPRGLPKEERYGRYAYYRSAVPDVNIRHSNAFTRQRMTKDQFRSERSCREWTESDGVPGWGKTKGRFDEFLAKLK